MHTATTKRFGNRTQIAIGVHGKKRARCLSSDSALRSRPAGFQNIRLFPRSSANHAAAKVL